MVHTYAVSILEAEARKPPFQSSPGLHSELQVTMATYRSCFNTKPNNQS